MWCKNCGQDVPAIQMATPGGASCARCGGMFTRGADASVSPAIGLADVAAHGVDLCDLAPETMRYPSFDDWEIDQNYRHLQARVGHWKRPARPAKRIRQSASHSLRRIDAGHDLGRPHKPRSRAAGQSSPTGWMLFSLGLVTFACGVVIFGWSLIEHRSDLWSTGMFVTVAGQIVLLFGVLLQLERVARNGRNAARKIDQVDAHLHELERNTEVLSITHGSASQAFYAHMVEQANPELLLADLKGQLDLLAVSMARRSA